MGEWLSILYISKKVVQKELNTSRGVVKHPIYIKKRLFERNLTLLGEWLSILYISKKVVRKELNTSGEVVKHPIYIKKRLFGRNLTLLGEWLSILYQKTIVRTDFIIPGKYIIIIFGHMLFGFITFKEASDCLHSRRS